MTTDSGAAKGDIGDIIEAGDLGKSFGGIKAVDGISFHVGKGESFGILGPNGAGKTTAIRMIYGLFPKDSGRTTRLWTGYRQRLEKDTVP